MDVFSLFVETPFVFFEVKRGGVMDNQIISRRNLKGVFKMRDGMTQGSREVHKSDATLHVHPEDFDNQQLVGHGVNIDGVDYKIIGQTNGTNFNTGRVEHIRLTLERSFYA
jgi:hypothetical protein|nr:MAG TPA: hypothetical protein [Caudoviricetes sp.]